MTRGLLTMIFHILLLGMLIPAVYPLRHSRFINGKDFADAASLESTHLSDNVLQGKLWKVDPNRGLIKRGITDPLLDQLITAAFILDIIAASPNKTALQEQCDKYRSETSANAAIVGVNFVVVSTAICGAASGAIQIDITGAQSMTSLISALFAFELAGNFFGTDDPAMFCRTIDFMALSALGIDSLALQKFVCTLGNSLTGMASITGLTPTAAPTSLTTTASQGGISSVTVPGTASTGISISSPTVASTGFPRFPNTSSIAYTIPATTVPIFPRPTIPIPWPTFTTLSPNATLWLPTSSSSSSIASAGTASFISVTPPTTLHSTITIGPSGTVSLGATKTADLSVASSGILIPLPPGVFPFPTGTPRFLPTPPQRRGRRVGSRG